MQLFACCDCILLWMVQLLLWLVAAECCCWCWRLLRELQLLTFAERCCRRQLLGLLYAGGGLPNAAECCHQTLLLLFTVGEYCC